MPECDAEFEHECKTNGFSQSMEHDNVWYCKNAYRIFLAARQKVHDDNQKALSKAIEAVS